MNNVFVIAGYLGSLLLLLAYFQVSHGRWKARSYIFQGTNAVAACLLFLYSLTIEAYPNVLLNAVFLSIAAAALFSIATKKRKY